MALWRLKLQVQPRGAYTSLQLQYLYFYHVSNSSRTENEESHRMHTSGHEDSQFLAKFGDLPIEILFTRLP